MLPNNPSKYMISIVVPISKMSGKLNLLHSWLQEIGKHENAEVILVHDKQDELTSRDLKGVIQSVNSKHIKLVEKQVLSPGLARNIGLKMAQGQWIAFADSDDQVLVKTLLSEVNKFKESKADALVFDYNKFHVNDKSIINFTHNSRQFNVGWNPGIWRWVFKSSSLKEVEFSQHRMGEDQLFLMKFLSNPKDIILVPKATYVYVVGNEFQLTHSGKAIAELPKLMNEVTYLRENNKGQKSPITEVMYLHLSITAFLSSIRSTAKKQYIAVFVELMLKLLRIRFFAIIKSIKRVTI